MSKATKRKHVQRETRQDYFAPPSKGQSIVRILNSRGNNLHEVEGADKEKYLVSMPTKFRKNIWVKRGDFVIVEPIREGDKVKAEMHRVLSKEHIKYFKKINVWPTSFEINVDETGNRHRAFSESSTSSSESSTESDSSDECDDDDDDDDDDEDDSDEEGFVDATNGKPENKSDDATLTKEPKDHNGRDCSYVSNDVSLDKMKITSPQNKVKIN